MFQAREGRAVQGTALADWRVENQLSAPLSLLETATRQASITYIRPVACSPGKAVFLDLSPPLA